MLARGYERSDDEVPGKRYLSGIASAEAHRLASRESTWKRGGRFSARLVFSSHTPVLPRTYRRRTSSHLLRKHTPRSRRDGLVTLSTSGGEGVIDRQACRCMRRGDAHRRATTPGFVGGVPAHPVAYFTWRTLLAVSARLRAHGRVNQTRAARL